jgi:hypothetical protein
MRVHLGRVFLKLLRKSAIAFFKAVIRVLASANLLVDTSKICWLRQASSDDGTSDCVLLQISTQIGGIIGIANDFCGLVVDDTFVAVSRSLCCQ